MVTARQPQAKPVYEFAKGWLKKAGRSPGDGPAPGAPAFIDGRLGGGDRAAKRPAPPAIEAAAVETRGAERFVPRTTSTSLTLAGGKRIDARVINVSRLAVAVEAEFATFDAATVTKVGSRPVRKGRAIRRGMVFSFEKPIDPALCGPNLIL